MKVRFFVNLSVVLIGCFFVLSMNAFAWNGGTGDSTSGTNQANPRYGNTDGTGTAYSGESRSYTAEDGSTVTYFGPPGGGGCSPSCGSYCGTKNTK